MKTICLKKCILIPLMMALCVLLVAFVLNVYHNQNNVISESVLKHLESTYTLFEKKLDSDTELINALIERAIYRDPQIRAAFLAKDRTRLIELTLPLLEDFRSKYRITHLYFHNTNSVNFLRVHKPEKYGDRIDRYTLIKAKKSGQPFAGVELGPLGTFTLRSVHPWRSDNKVIGYIEMGEEIAHIINDLQHVSGAELYVAIHKEFLVREEWESGMRMLGHQPKWDQFPSSVIISQTLKVTPPIIGNFLSVDHHEPKKMISDSKLTIGNRLYWWGFLPLYDAKGIENGEIVALFDMTEPNANAHKAVLVISLIYTVIGILLFISFYIMLGRVERHLEKSHLSLIEAHNELETKVEERTTELVKANKELHNLSAHLQSIREEERTHVAREIHDELGQILTGLQIDFSNLIMELPQKKKALIEKGRELSELIDRSIITVQRISEELRPSLLDKLGIIPAIEWHAEEFQNRIGIKCEFTYDTEALVLDKDRSLAIFRIFQEALTNVARHANATKVVIDLKNENNSIILQINDNGMGIAKEEIASTKSLGIIGIRERSQAVGGDIKIDTAYGKGTTITLTVPLSEKGKESIN